MDAMIITLVVTLPIIGVGTTLYLWVRRSPTEKQARRRKTALVVGAVLVCFLPSIWFGIQNSKWYRSRIGYRAVAFANNTSAELRDLEFVFRDGKGAGETNRLETFSAGGKYEHSVCGDSASNLVLERISCLSGAARLVCTNVGVAGRGEILSIRLNSTAGFVISHE
jgi:hypothetical protein